MKRARKGTKVQRRAKTPARPGTAGPTEGAIFELFSNVPGRKEKIYPRNLTALAAVLVHGNPVVTRPEDAVANCFPGLEMDIRNLDRRFFPGLVFEFVDDGAKLAYVDPLSDPDLQLTNPQTTRFLEEYGIAENIATKLISDIGEIGAIADQYFDEPTWYLDWIEQKKNGKRHRFSTTVPDEDNTRSIVWRLVRSLEPGPMRIGLKLLEKLDEDAEEGAKRKVLETLTLSGWRRRYTDVFTGVISNAYQPGELMQGLCSPWQHDFRDCQCFYWAANHPDAVLGEVYPGEATLSGGSASPSAEALASPHPVQVDNRPVRMPLSPPPGEKLLKSLPLDWMRSSRARTMDAEARATIAENRPYQMDAYEINSRWQDLSMVLEGREIGSLYIPQSDAEANPFPTREELYTTLKEYLAPLELALTFEYLYALFSLKSVDQVKGDELKGAVKLARDRLLLVTMSEMQHLRWVNEIIWNLPKEDPKKPDALFEPVLDIPSELVIPASPLKPKSQMGADGAKKNKQLVEQYIRTERDIDSETAALLNLSASGQSDGAQGSGAKEKPERKPALRRLTPDVIDDFVAVEHPSGLLDGAYAQVIATLHQDTREPRLPRHLVELPLRIAGDGVQHEIRFLELKQALEPFKEHQFLRDITPDAEKAAPALRPLATIKHGLRKAYHFAGNRAPQVSGRFIKDTRGAMTDLFAVGERLAKKGIGIPFFDYWNSIK